jgi:hypothetical protein
MRAEVIHLYDNVQTRVNAELVAMYWLIRATIALACGVIVILITSRLSLLPDFLNLLIFISIALVMARTTQWLDKASSRIKPALLADEREYALRQYKAQQPSMTEDDVQRFLADWDKKRLGVQD